MIEQEIYRIKLLQQIEQKVRINLTDIMIYEYNKKDDPILSILTNTYNLKQSKINTINKKGKKKIVRGRKAKKSGYKKAIVTLKKGQTIDLTTGI